MKYLKLIVSKIRKEYRKIVYRKLHKKKKCLKGKVEREKCKNIGDVLTTHFKNYTDEQHACRDTLSLALELLDEKPARIIETGSSSWGANSSMLFDLYVSNFGGSFNSVDIRIEPAINLSNKCSNLSNFWCDDSANWLSKNINKNSEEINLVYLDSWDLNPEEPIKSALHSLNEFLTLLPLLKKGCLVLIDDTPINEEHALRVQGDTWSSQWVKSRKKYGFPPGKGSLIKQYIELNSLGEILEHKYQLLIRI